MEGLDWVESFVLIWIDWWKSAVHQPFFADGISSCSPVFEQHVVFGCNIKLYKRILFRFGGVVKV